MSANPNSPNAGLNVAEMAKTLDEKAKAHESALGGHEALQALLAFSALHAQIRQKRALGSADVPSASDSSASGPGEDTWKLEQFVLDEVLHMVAERAQIVTGADGVAIALADRDAIICRASVGMIVPDPGVRLDTNSGFSGVCFRSAEVVRCDDSESDQRVDIQNCRHLGARSMVAVPLLAKSNVIGLLEAFSTEPYAFDDSDVRGLKLLAELILAAMKPEEEDRLAEISRNAVAEDSALKKNSAPKEIHSEATPENPSGDLPAEDSSTSKTAAVESHSNISLTSADQPAPALRASEANSTAGELSDELILSDVASSAATDHADLDLLRSYVPAGDPSSSGKPGLQVVLLLVVIAALIGGYVWWSMQHRSRRRVAAATPNPPVAAAIPPVTASQPPADDSDIEVPTRSPNLNHGALPAVTGVRHWSSPNSSTVVVDLQEQVQYEAHRLTNPDRIYFDLHDTSLAPALTGQTIKIGDAFLQRVRVAQPVKGITRVVLETTASTSSFSVSMEENPCRLVVEVGKGNASLQGDTSSNMPATQTPVASPTSQQSQLKTGAVPSLRIVVDPGHGGWDLGTVGRTGLLEKDLVLDIAQRLSSLLQKDLNADVILTRSDNTYVSLERRAEIANLAKADLFVSIHANYSSSTSARGVETYYTDTYSSVHARTPDSSAAAGTAPDWTNVDIRTKVQESRQLAQSVQRTLFGMLSQATPGLENRGTKEAGYAVLTGTTMPAILAEVSFVSSPPDEAKLRQEAYRERIARALYDGISRYVTDNRKVKIAAMSSARR